MRTNVSVGRMAGRLGLSGLVLLLLVGQLMAATSDTSHSLR